MGCVGWGGTNPFARSSVAVAAAGPVVGLWRIKEQPTFGPPQEKPEPSLQFVHHNNSRQPAAAYTGICSLMSPHVVVQCFLVQDDVNHALTNIPWTN